MLIGGVQIKKVVLRKVSSLAKLPFKATAGSAGFDVCAALSESMILSKGKVCKVPSGLAVSLPDPSCVAVLVSRSGLSVNRGISLANGVGIIDSDFRGEIVVALRNFSDRDYVIEPGDRVAQILFFDLLEVVFDTISDFNSDTPRGTGGLGSTGV